MRAISVCSSGKKFTLFNWRNLISCSADLWCGKAGEAGLSQIRMRFLPLHPESYLGMELGGTWPGLNLKNSCFPFSLSPLGQRRREGKGRKRVMEVLAPFPPPPSKCGRGKKSRWWNEKDWIGGGESPVGWHENVFSRTFNSFIFFMKYLFVQGKKMVMSVEGREDDPRLDNTRLPFQYGGEKKSLLLLPWKRRRFPLKRSQSNPRWSSDVLLWGGSFLHPWKRRCDDP